MKTSSFLLRLFKQAKACLLIEGDSNDYTMARFYSIIGTPSREVEDFAYLKRKG